MNIEFEGIKLLKKDEKPIEKAIQQLFGHAFFDGFLVTVSFLDEIEMKKLQKRFGKINSYATDVLSFPIPMEERQFPHTKKILGDIVICVEKAEKQASKYGHTFLEEVVVLCAHGLYHLLGLDHERSKEEADMQMQAEMALLEMAGFKPELCLIGRSII